MGMRKKSRGQLPEYLIMQRHPLLESLGVATDYFPNYVNESPFPHVVDVVLLNFIIKGDAIHWIDGERYQERGVSLGVTHYDQSHTIVTGPEGIEILNIYLNPNKRPLPSLPDPLCRVLPDMLPLHPGFHNVLNRIVRISFECPEKAVSLALGMHWELQARRPGFQAAVLEYFKLFLMECCRSVLSLGLRPAGGASPAASELRLEELRRFLDASYAKQFTLGSLAKKASLNRNYLCRVFRSYTGKSVFDYLHERRLQAAMMALRDSDEKVAAIAFESGFRDLSFFNRKFREAVGLTPSAYRRQWR